MNPFSLNSRTTLFLDRDGVINREIVGSYVLRWNEFFFLEGVLDAMKLLNGLFPIIVMVTNQKCIGKKLLSEVELSLIHSRMMSAISEAGGRIDQIYYCGDLLDESPFRKPNAGMALRAKKDFPAIDFNNSIMVGNKLGDMQFGRNAGMHTCFIASTNPETSFPHPQIDFRFNSLLDFSLAASKGKLILN